MWAAPRALQGSGSRNVVTPPGESASRSRALPVDSNARRSPFIAVQRRSAPSPYGSRWPSALPESGSACSFDGFASVLDLQFGEDAADVVANRLCGDDQGAGDLAVGQASGD